MTLKLGIIGGSGLYNFAELENKNTLITKPGTLGKASGDIEYGKIDGVEIFFLPRHGKNHIYSPSNVPYRANIDTLKRFGCNDIISVSAVTL